MAVICETKPIAFDRQQLAKCKACNMASAQVRWCGRWGIEVGYPSKIQMAKSLGKASIDQARAGFPTRSPEKVAEIMRICKQCPSYVKDAERCLKCGCCSKKIKWATQNCPVGKW